MDVFLQEWLGRYLTGVTAAVILVSHEQEFIEKSCNHIAEVISCTLGVVIYRPCADTKCF